MYRLLYWLQSKINTYMSIYISRGFKNNKKYLKVNIYVQPWGLSHNVDIHTVDFYFRSFPKLKTSMHHHSYVANIRYLKSD